MTEELAIPKELEDLLMTLGKVEWGATAALDAEGHAQHIAKSVTNSAKHFEQEGPQPMHGLYLDGSEIVVCHTGTSPNSANIARILTGAWNLLVDQAEEQHWQQNKRSMPNGSTKDAPHAD